MSDIFSCFSGVENERRCSDCVCYACDTPASACREVLSIIPSFCKVFDMVWSRHGFPKSISIRLYGMKSYKIGSDHQTILDIFGSRWTLFHTSLCCVQWNMGNVRWGQCDHCNASSLDPQWQEYRKGRKESMAGIEGAMEQVTRQIYLPCVHFFSTFHPNRNSNLIPQPNPSLSWMNPNWKRSFNCGCHTSTP